MNRSGLTLVELVLGIAVTSIIFMAATSAYVFLVKSSSRLGSAQGLEQAKTDLQQEFTTAVRWGTNISSLSPNLTIDGKAYTLVNNRLMRGGKFITAENIQVTQMAVTDYSIVADRKSLKIVLSLKEATSLYPPQVLTIVASQRQNSYTHEDQ